MGHVRKVALCSVLLLVAACGGKGTFVVVHVDKAGTLQAAINRIDLELALAGKTATATLRNPGGGDLSFPTDAVLDVQSGSGQMEVTAIAFDGGGNEISRTTASVGVQRDQTASISLVFGGGSSVEDMTMPPEPDLSGSNIALSATTHDYGTLVTGTTLSFTFTVTNHGAVPTSALATAISGTDGSLFTLMNDGCSGTTLASGAACMLDVVFSAASAGDKSATLTVTGSGADIAVASLSGTAVPPAALAIAPTTGHDFGGYLPGTPSAAFTFTVTNGGGVASSNLVVGATGSMAGEFVVSNDTCTGMTLPANGAGSCTFDVTFTPGGTGPRGASVTARGTPGGTAVAAVSGTGLNPATLVVHGGVTSHDFMVVQPGSLSALFTIQIDNTGDVASGTPTPSITGTDAGEFAYANHCTTPIAAGGNCTVDLTFSPATGGSKSATFSLAATPGGTASITLAGQAPPAAPGGVVSCGGDGKLRVYFTPSVGATSHNMYVSTTTPVNRATATKMTNVPLTGSNGFCANNTTCFAVVTAVNAFGESVNSSEVSAPAAPAIGNAVLAGAFSANAIDIFDNYSGLGSSTTGASRTLIGANTGLSNPTSIAVSKPYNDLYVASRANATVRMWHGAATVNGNTAPSRILTSVNAPNALALDAGRDRLYVIDQGTLKIWNRACAINGNAPADATVTLGGGVGPFEIFADEAKDMLYIASNSTFRGIAVLHQASTLTGTINKSPDRTITIIGAPASPTYLGVSVDLTNDFLYVGINNGNAYSLANASTLNTATAPTSTATGATPYVHAAALTMMDFTDCSGTIKAWSPTNPFGAGPTKLMNSGLTGPCYESVWYTP